MDEGIENPQSLFERIGNVSKRVKEIVDNLDESKNEKLLIVGHSMIFKAWSTNKLEKESLEFDNKKIPKMKNCQVKGFDLTW